VPLLLRYVQARDLETFLDICIRMGVPVLAHMCVRHLVARRLDLFWKYFSRPAELDAPFLSHVLLMNPQLQTHVVWRDMIRLLAHKEAYSELVKRDIDARSVQAFRMRPGGTIARLTAVLFERAYKEVEEDDDLIPLTDLAYTTRMCLPAHAYTESSDTRRVFVRPAWVRILRDTLVACRDLPE
jgi:hypothetical protein